MSKKTKIHKVIGRQGYRVKLAEIKTRVPHIKKEVTYLDFTGKA